MLRPKLALLLTEIFQYWYWRTSHQTDECGTRHFWWVRAQGPDTPDGPQNSSGTVAIPPKRSISGTRR